MLNYYKLDDIFYVSDKKTLPLPPVPAPPANCPVTFILDDDKVLGRGRFRVTHTGQLTCPHNLDVLDASRLPQTALHASLQERFAAQTLSATSKPLQNPHFWTKSDKKKRVHLLALGDVGSTLLLALKILGGDVISSIGICDISPQACARMEFEMGQIALPWDYDALPEVEIISQEQLFCCDVFIFVASKGIPPVGSQVKDVRMAQFETNATIARQYARMARNAKFAGLWAAVSDPVDPLAKTVYLESNTDENGVFDGKGLLPEQVQGYGLGVMNARAAYYAKRDETFSSFLSDGQAFGPHGQGLWIANSLSHYDEEISKKLTELTVNANMQMRALGFKPYLAPALSSGALSILLTLRGMWHYGSVYLDGVYLGVKNRYTPYGIETMLYDALPPALFSHIQDARDHLISII